MTTCTVCELHAESVFRIEGMDCHQEVAILQRRLTRLAGLEALDADVVGQRLSVKYDAARLTTGHITAAVAETGMRAWLEEAAAPPPAESSRFGDWLLGSSGLLVGVGLLLEFAAHDGWARAAFAVAIVGAGTRTARRAWQSVRARVLDIQVLMMVAVAGAIALGQWSEAAAVVCLFAVAQWLETHAMARARGAIRALMALAPRTALVRRDNLELTLPVEEVRVGDRVIVRPGERIPLDGVLASGAGDVDQAPVTGESRPIEKAAGDELFAGTINGRASLEVEVTRLGRDSTIARIIHLVERAQAQRAPMQAFVDRFARIYTPAVLALALAVAFLPPLVAGASWSAWVYRALVLLVIACPCALVISTPVSIVSALAAAARRGVLIKGGARLEPLAQVRVVAFDKTGTLTTGRQTVLTIMPSPGVDAGTVIATAAALEVRSEHPIGRAIVARARADGLTIPPGGHYHALHGRGAEGDVGTTRVVVGSPRLFDERGIDVEALRPTWTAHQEQGHSIVLVAVDGRAIGALAIADRVRESAAAAVAGLRRLGIAHVALLSGDHEAVARSLAQTLALDDVRASLLPEDKVAAVQALRARYGRLAMVGDGVNDAPALASADVGIAMGAAGTDVALETADIALMSDDLTSIPYVIALSRATMRNIRTNVSFSLAVKGVFFALAVAGHSSLWMAVIADTGASLLVVANALRLLRR
ncbi:MAG: heavy metal translocating P-type ATPase [Vicinamibacterales bacterium]